MKEEINSIKNLLYSGQKINVDLAISIMQGLGLTWNSAGFKEEKELIDLCGVDAFTKTDLNLSHNNISSLPKSIGELQHLVKLDLDYNELEVLPESIVQLQQIEVLWLYHNNLSSIPKSIGQLQNLRSLILKDNIISSIPKSIGQLQNLKKLWIDDNPISENEIDKIKALLPNCKIIPM